MNDEEAIRNLYHDMYEAMILKDRTRLCEILSDDFVLVHMTGMNQTRDEYLRAIRDGVLNYFSEQTSDISITLSKDRAHMTGRSRVEASVFGGSRHTWRLQLDITLARHKDLWQMTRAEASTY